MSFDAFIMHEVQVTMLLSALGLTEESISSGPPKRPSATHDTRHSQEELQTWVAACEDWQDRNSGLSNQKR